jgi:DNA-binding NarL/FixJ family response regulator
MASKILIADDHPLFRDAVKMAVAKAQPGAVVIDCGNFNDALAQLHGGQAVNLFLLDLYLPDVDGFAGLLQLRSEFPHLAVAVVSACDDADIIAKAIGFGAQGYIPKTSSLEEICAALLELLAGHTSHPELVAAAPEVLSGFSTLTPAQLKVLGHLKNGQLNKQIAYDMEISEATVKAHMTAIFRKLNVRSRTQAVIAAAALALPEQRV